MFRFEHPEFVWLISVTLVVVGSFIVRKRNWIRDLSDWGSASTIKKIGSRIKDSSPLTWLIVTAFLIINIAALNPQWGTKTRTIDKKTAEVYILFDISNSMLAEDIAPSRLERAKRFALDLAAAFKNDRVGLVVFAGNAYMQSPLTTDWNAIQLYLNSAHPDQAGTQGTVIGKAVGLAVSSRSSEEEKGEGAIIIITDGEDHDEDAVESVKDALEEGWTTYVVGVGTEKGGMIPVVINDQKDFKRDQAGEAVVTAMNTALMTNLAQQGNGKFYNITEGAGIIEDLKTELAKIERTHLDKRSFSEHKSYYQWFLMGAIIIMLTVVTIRYKYDVV